ncbi:metal ABC transporter solute-binding protein, Zn/Mn family, partial [Castellaniella sp.]|uniref:metal ABC transporter solute-binding protein, Zn/Mn family n=1 Tax=Castellaniella sp. TaxID=1955812 RepID=UPI00356A323C
GLWQAWRRQRRKMARGVGAGVWLAPVLALAGLAASPVPARAAEAPLRVVATFSILGDMVREVGGDQVAVHVVVGPLAEVHDHEPTPGDLQALGQAQVLVSNGLGLESWLPALRSASGFDGLDVVATQGVVPRVLPGQGGPDPHAWQDPALGVRYLENIAAGLAQADPGHAGQYRARAGQLAARLLAADARWRAQLAQIPPEHRVLATAHDAFGYLAQAWGLRILPLRDAGGHAEPSARAMAAWIRELKAQPVRALFLEQGSPSQALQQVSRETGVPLAGPLFADALDAPGRPAGTYLGMLEHNAGQLLEALVAAPAQAGGPS